ncbi:MAG: flavin monoamine oxidase family protein [Sandaracinaceae bacterium]|nr:flavin monoamine oxidase family protein [Sandaracinaceae bacterium]
MTTQSDNGAAPNRGALDADVIVVGGGLSGLQAARRLVAKGQRVIVLEARDQVGGRTKTVEVNGHRFDVGGQWTGPGQPRMYALIKELGLETTPTYAIGKRILDLRGRISTYSGMIPRVNPWTLIVAQIGIWKIDRLCAQVPKDNPWDCPRALEWDGMTALDWAKRNLRDESVIAMVNGAVRVIFGTDLANLSFLHFLHYLHSGGGFAKLIESHDGQQDSWVVGGAQQLCTGMVPLAGTVHTSAPVRKITQDSQGVSVVSDVGTFTAKRVVVTVPIALADRIQYEPPLPTMRDQMTQRCGMGATIKVLALYESSFWRDAGYSGESVSTDLGTITFDDTTPGGQAALLMFVTGSPARGWSERPAEERRRFVLDTLVRYFGEQARNPTHYLENDWAAEPFVLGAPIATFPPGTLSAFGPALRAPVGRIHWAGTETALDSTGFMEGALESGDRVAAEVLAAR